MHAAACPVACVHACSCCLIFFFCMDCSFAHAQIELVEQLLAAQNLLETPLDVLDLNRRNCEGATPLHVAVASEASAQLVSRLIELGARVHDKDGHGQTALFCAAARGSRSLTSVLVRLYSARDAHERTRVHRLAPLHAAALGGHADVVEVLLQCGSLDINATTATLCTPLHCAALAGSIECLRALLQAGANPDLQTCHGQTALELIANEALRASASVAIAEARQSSSQRNSQGMLQKRMVQLLCEEDAYVQKCTTARLVKTLANKTSKNPLSKSECDACARMESRLEGFLETRYNVKMAIGQAIIACDSASSLDRVAERVDELVMKNSSFYTTIQRYVMEMYSTLTIIYRADLGKLNKALGLNLTEAGLEDAFRIPLLGLHTYTSTFKSIRDCTVQILGLPDHCSPPFDDMVDEMQKLCVKLDAFVEQLENKFRGERIQACVHGEYGQIADASRKLIRTGMLTKSPGSGNGRNQKRFFALFSDILIYAAASKKANSYEFKGMLLLAATEIRTLPQADPPAFELQSVSEKGRVSFTIYAESRDELRLWIKAIDNAIKDCLESSSGSRADEAAESSAAGVRHPRPSVVGPVPVVVRSVAVDDDDDAENETGGAAGATTAQAATTAPAAGSSAAQQPASGSGAGSNNGAVAGAVVGGAVLAGGAAVVAGGAAGASSGAGAGAGSSSRVDVASSSSAPASSLGRASVRGCALPPSLPSFSCSAAAGAVALFREKIRPNIELLCLLARTDELAALLASSLRFSWLSSLALSLRCAAGLAGATATTFLVGGPAMGREAGRGLGGGSATTALVPRGAAGAACVAGETGSPRSRVFCCGCPGLACLLGPPPPAPLPPMPAPLPRSLSFFSFTPDLAAGDRDAERWCTATSACSLLALGCSTGTDCGCCSCVEDTRPLGLPVLACKPPSELSDGLGSEATTGSSSVSSCDLPTASLSSSKQ